MIPDKKPYLVGIAGGSASGKTTIMNELRKNFGTGMSVISQDNYYTSPVIDANGKPNYDLPECVDLDKLTSDIKELCSGQSIKRKEYLFEVKDEPKILEIHPAPVIVCEGLFVFHHKEIRDLLDLKVFVFVDQTVALERRLKRDVAERNLPKDQIMYQWNEHVLPSYEKFLKPFQDKSDVVIDTMHETYKWKMGQIERMIRGNDYSN